MMPGTCWFSLFLLLTTPLVFFSFLPLVTQNGDFVVPSRWQSLVEMQVAMHDLDVLDTPADMHSFLFFSFSFFLFFLFFSFHFSFLFFT